MLKNIPRRKRREALAKKADEATTSPPPPTAAPPPLPLSTSSTNDPTAPPPASAPPPPSRSLGNDPVRSSSTTQKRPADEAVKPVSSITITTTELTNDPTNGGVEQQQQQQAQQLSSPLTLSSLDDAVTVHTSGNAKRTPTKKKTSKKNLSVEDQLEYLKTQVQQEKAGKRKIFHSLVKLANELRKTRTDALPALEYQKYMSKHWYDGGLWRSPALLPASSSSSAAAAVAAASAEPQPYRALREPLSLLALFFDIIILIAWMRAAGSLHVVVMDATIYNNDVSWLCYTTILWCIWCKQTAYATRFDTTDLSGQAVTAGTGLLVLFTSFTVTGSLHSADGDRVMLLAAAVAVLHLILHVRVALCFFGQSDQYSTVFLYAVLTSIMNLLEAAAWLVGLYVFPQDYEYRWAIFLGGFVLSLRLPRGVLPNDFQASYSQRNVLVLLLLGFILQNIVTVANDYLSYRTPTWEEYSFLGAICVTLLCIQFLYVDDADTVSMDHALIVNSWTGFFFHIGHLLLLLCLTVLGNALSSLTHGYFRENNGNATSTILTRVRVSEGFTATLLAIFFLNSLHVKRVPAKTHRAVFVTAYLVQALLIVTILGVAVAMQFGFCENLTNLELAWLVAATAIVVMVVSWIDEIAELSLYTSNGEAREARSEPLTFWCCVTPRVVKSSVESGSESESDKPSSLTPLLGGAESSKEDGYQSVDESVFSAPPEEV